MINKVKSCFRIKINMSLQTDSNRQLSHYKCDTLPIKVMKAFIEAHFGNDPISLRYNGRHHPLNA